MEATALHKLMPRPDMSNHIQYFSFFEILFKSAKQLEPFLHKLTKSSETAILQATDHCKLRQKLLVVKKCSDEEDRRGCYEVVKKTALELVWSAATLL